MKIILTERQLYRKKLVMQCIKKQCSTKEAAIKAGLNIRTIQKDIQKYKEKGDCAFIHGNTGKIRTNPEKIKTKNQIIDLFLNTRIENENPFENISYTYFTEILNNTYNLKCSVTWVKHILNSINYKTPIKHKCKNTKIHLFRPRKEHIGELIQADGTPYDWFSDGHSYCIQGFVDDATGYPVGLYMTKNECLLGYTEALRNMAYQFGIPQQLYPDKAEIFFVNQKTVLPKVNLDFFAKANKVVQACLASQ